MERAALHNLGCKVNAYETEAMQAMLERAGYTIVDFNQEADVYIINTCSVTNMADRKSRQMIHRAKKKNPNAIVVAAGCYVQASSEEAAKDLAIDIIIGNNKKNDLLKMIDEYKEKNRTILDVADLTHNTEYENMDMIKFAEHTRAFVKVQDGCNQFCSYCIIPYTRGRVRSRKEADVLEEVRHLAENGYQEIVLTGIHLSSYGIDCQSSLQKLIESISEIEKIRRIRLGSLEPGIITEEFIQSISKNKKVCPHFHLSLQSGCDATLRRMNRKYTLDEYSDKCDLIRAYYEHPALTTDVIVGFPQEDEEEFAMTKQFLEKIKFYEVHLFKYSRRKGTKAAVMSGQVPEQEKTKRSAEAANIVGPIKHEFIHYYDNHKIEVLFEEEEEIEGELYYIGYSREYVKCAMKADADYTNRFITGTVIKTIGEDILLIRQ